MLAFILTIKIYKSKPNKRTFNFQWYFIVLWKFSNNPLEMYNNFKDNKKLKKSNYKSK
jgi:hypothetical protein